MRLLVGFLTCLSVGGLSVVALSPALANDPTPQTPAATATASSTSHSATPVAPANQPTPSSTQSAKSTELTADEKKLLSQGYKMETRHGEHYFCHAEAETGSHFQKKTCGTAQEFASRTQNSKEMAHDAERVGLGPMGK